jgi:hypothetical protein
VKSSFVRVLVAAVYWESVYAIAYFTAISVPSQHERPSLRNNLFFLHYPHSSCSHDLHDRLFNRARRQHDQVAPKRLSTQPSVIPRRRYSLDIRRYAQSSTRSRNKRFAWLLFSFLTLIGLSHTYSCESQRIFSMEY